MKSNLKNLALALIASSAIVAPTLAANDSPWMVRARGILVAPAEHADVSIGGDVEIDNTVVPEVDVTYFFSDNFAVEVIAAVTPHDVMHTFGVDLGTVWLLPPTATLQYHFDPKGASMRPYVGVGVNYTTFFGVDEPAGLNIDYDDSFGLALQAGIDIPFGNGWSVNVDVKKIYINTDVSITGTVTAEADVDIDPVVFGVGVGYRY